MKFIQIGALLAAFGFAAVSGAPAEQRGLTAYSLTFSLLGLSLATEKCADVPASGVAKFEQFIGGLDCSKTGETSTDKTFTCELTSNLTGDLGGILGGTASACGSAGGRPDGGRLLSK